MFDILQAARLIKGQQVYIDQHFLTQGSSH